MWLAYCLSGSLASMRRNSVPSCDLYSFHIYPLPWFSLHPYVLVMDSSRLSQYFNRINLLYVTEKDKSRSGTRIQRRNVVGRKVMPLELESRTAQLLTEMISQRDELGSKEFVELTLSMNISIEDVM